MTFMHNGTSLKCTDIHVMSNSCVYNGYGIVCTACELGYLLNMMTGLCGEVWGSDLGLCLVSMEWEKGETIMHSMQRYLLSGLKFNLQQV